MSGRDIFRRIVVILAAALLGLALLVAGSVTLVLSTETGTGWALSQALAQINKLPGQQVTVASSGGTLVAGLQLDRIDYQSNVTHVQVEQAEISWNPLSLLSARVAVSELLLNNVQVELISSDTAAEQPSQSTGPLLSFTPLPVVIDIGLIRVRQLIIQQSQQQFAINEISVAVQLQNQSLDITALNLNSDIVDIAGDLILILDNNLPVDTELSWQIDNDIYPGSGPASGTLNLDGDLATLQLRHQLQEPFLLTSTGSIETGLAGGEPGIDLTHSSDTLEVPQTAIENLSLSNVNLTTAGGLELLEVMLTTSINSELTPATSLALQANWQPGMLVLDELQLATRTGQLGASGEFSLGETVAGTLRFQLADSSPLDYVDVGLPLEIINLRSSGDMEFSLVDNVPQGALRLGELSGQFGDYPFQGQGQVRYNDNALQFEGVQLSTTANQLVVDGTLAEELDFNWAVDAPQLNQFVAELGGELQASGQIFGDLADVQLVTDIAAQSISYNDLFVDDLQMSLQRLGQTIEGSIEVTQAGLRSAERTDSIQSLTVLVEGTDAQHQLSLAAASDYGDLELSLQGGFTDLTSFNWDGALSAGRLNTALGEWRMESASDITFDSSSFDLTGNCWRQNDATVCLQGAGENQPEGLSLQVGGEINSYPLSVFNHPDFQTDGTTPAVQSLQRLPEMVGLAGTADAELSFTMASDGSTSVTVNLQPEEVFLTLRSIEPEMAEDIDSDAASGQDTESDEPNYTEQVYGLDSPRLNATLDNGSWALEAATGISGADTADGTEPLRGTLESQVNLSPDSELSGGLQASLGDIGWLEAFSQDIDDLEGSLTGAITLAGTLSEPVFGVDIQLADGQVSVPPLGITIEQVTSSVISRDDGSIQLTTNAHSGDGTLELQGLVSEPFSTARSLSAQLSGSDFRLAEIPDLSLVVTPDVTLTADDQKIEVAGSLLLPILVINLMELPETAVDISRDAVIIDFPADQPQLARSIASEQSTFFNRPVVADVDISLGEQVSFNGFGLTTRVAGNLNVRQQENGTNLTYGELEIVSGQYTLYGRSLQIRQGKLLFFGAYDNPALDIRATREVESATVGVLMNGTLKNINSQLFSTPAYSDSDIIAIMITGKPFAEIGQGEGNAVVGAIANLGLSRSQGLTNQVREQLGLDTLAITNTGNINNSILTVGKYLTPDLFIRYGIGLFDHQSKLAVDYTLTERITLQAESGEYQSVDVIYRLER